MIVPRNAGEANVPSSPTRHLLLAAWIPAAGLAVELARSFEQQLDVVGAVQEGTVGRACAQLAALARRGVTLDELVLDGGLHDL